MTKKEFEEAYARNSDFSLEKLRAAGMRAVECTCGHEGCEGWRMKSQPEPCTKCAKKKKTVTAA